MKSEDDIYPIVPGQVWFFTQNAGMNTVEKLTYIISVHDKDITIAWIEDSKLETECMLKSVFRGCFVRSSMDPLTEEYMPE